MLNMLEYSKKVFITVVIIAATVIIPYLIYRIFPHFIPFILAYFTALVLEPLNLFFMKRLKLKRTPANTITFIIFLGIIFLLAYLIISKIYVQLLGLLAFIQDNGPLIRDWVMNFTESIQDTISILPPNVAEQINALLLQLGNEFTNVNIVSKLVSYTYSLSTAIPNAFFLTLIYLISVFLFTFQLDNIRNRFYSFFKDSTQKKVALVLGDLRRATFGFFKAQVILSTITFLLSFSGLMIIGVRYPAIIAFIIVVVDILPILGTGSVLVPWAIISLFYGNIYMFISLLILFLIIIVIRKAIEPKILGERIGLSALATLISIWIGFKVMGILGVFLFPLALIFYKALVRVGIIRWKYKI